MCDREYYDVVGVRYEITTYLVGDRGFLTGAPVGCSVDFMAFTV